MSVMQQEPYVNVYDPKGQWVGFFIDKKTAKEWVGGKKGYKIESKPKRDVPAVPAPKPQPIKGALKKFLAPKKSKGVTQEQKDRAAQSERESKRSVKVRRRQVPQKDFDWTESDVENIEQLEQHAEESTAKAIKKMKGEK